MREPESFDIKSGERIPYSLVPTAWLKNFAHGLCHDGSPIPPGYVSQDEWCDSDVRRRYAAILLRERKP